LPLAPPVSIISSSGELTEAALRHLLAITRAVSDANRIRILCALSGRGELCVCQIQELLGLAPSTTSKHLGLLAAAGLVEARRDGRWAYYRIAREDMPEDAAELVAWLCRRAARTKAAAADRAKLRLILRHTPEELCQLQAKGAACCSSAPATPAAARSRKATPARSGRT
jgi:DNA-binding transcriptional ArsR family regulator